MRSYISVGLNRKPDQEEPADVGWRPEVGDSKTFVPSSFMADHQGTSLSSIRPDTVITVTGTVVYVNALHRWYRVRYETPGGSLQHESFKF